MNPLPIRQNPILPALLILFGSLGAQDAPPAGPPSVIIEQQTDLVTYTLSPEGMSLEEAVRLATEATGMPLTYRDSDLKGKGRIFMAGQVRVPKSKLQEFWQAIFITHQFAMIPMGSGPGAFNVLEPIANSQMLRQRATYVPHEDLGKFRSKAGEIIMTTITMKNVKVDQLRGTITTFLTQRTAEFNADVVSANAIVVMGFAPTIYALSQVLQAMDLPPAGPAPRVEVPKTIHPLAEQLQPVILAMATSKDALQRRGAALSLAALDEPAALPTLIALLKDDDAGVREAAVQALERLNAPRK